MTLAATKLVRGMAVPGGVCSGWDGWFFFFQRKLRRRNPRATTTANTACPPHMWGSCVVRARPNTPQEREPSQQLQSGITRPRCAARVRNSRPWCRTLHSLITPQGRRPSQRLQSGITRPRCAARVWPPRPQGRTMVGPVVPVVPGVSPVALLASRRPPHHHCCTKPRPSNHLHVRPKPCCSASACRVSAGGAVGAPAGRSTAKAPSLCSGA